MLGLTLLAGSNPVGDRARDRLGRFGRASPTGRVDGWRRAGALTALVILLSAGCGLRGAQGLPIRGPDVPDPGRGLLGAQDAGSGDAGDIATTVVRAAADGFVLRERPRATWGKAAVLRVRRPGVRAYLRFDPGPGRDRVIRAELRVWAGGSSATGVELRPVRPKAWTERTLTLETAPRILPPIAFSGWFGPGWVSLNATSLVRGDRPVGLALTGAAGARVTFASREADAHRPMLVLTTGPAAPVVAAAGDIACDPSDSNFNGGRGRPGSCQMRATAAVLGRTPALAAVLPLGDLQYDSAEVPSRWRTSYGPTWGRFKWLTRPAVGNHEYEDGGQGTYFRYFGRAAGHPDRGYYSFEVRSWHLIALNSECSEVSCDADSAQVRWLRADLERHRDQCVLAYWHRPRFSTGDHGSDLSTREFWKALYAAGADVVLNGHDHGYERIRPMHPSGTAAADGIRAFVVGTGGKSHYEFPHTWPASVVRDGTTFGVLLLTLHPDGYHWRFVPAADGSFTDGGSGRC